MSKSFEIFAGDSPYRTAAEDTGYIDRALPGTVIVDGVQYGIDTKEYARIGVEGVREGITQSGEPSENLYDHTGGWWRQRNDWRHGAGQELGDLEESANQRKFRTSVGVDPWGVNDGDFGLRLLPGIDTLATTTADPILMVVTGSTSGTGNQFLYYSDGTTLRRNTTAGSLAGFSAVTGLAGTITSLSTDGIDVYVATTSNIYRVGPASLAAIGAVAPAGSYTHVAFVANRLLAARTNVLTEIFAGATEVIIDTHLQATFRWNVMVAVGSRIYSGGYAGNRSELYVLTALSDGTLNRGQEAAPFPPNEIIHIALSFAGTLILGTSRGVRFAALGGDGTLTYGPLIEEGAGCRCVTTDRNFAWFGLTYQSDTELAASAGGVGVGRMALDQFTDLLLPAYAMDVGNRAETNAVTGVVRFLDRTIFSIAGKGVYASDDALVPVAAGIVRSGALYMGTIEDKIFTEVTVRTDEFTSAGQSVEVIVHDQAGVEIGRAIQNELEAVGLTLDLGGVLAQWVEISIVMRATTVSPVVRTWVVRGYPIPRFTEKWVVPLLVSSAVRVGTGEGQVVSYSPAEEMDRLIEMWRRKWPINFQEGRFTHRVRINNYRVSANKFTGNGEGFEGVLTLELMSV